MKLLKKNFDLFRFEIKHDANLEKKTWKCIVRKNVKGVILLILFLLKLSQNNPILGFYSKQAKIGHYIFLE